MTIRGGGGKGEGVGWTPNGENHLKFPFWLFEYLPKMHIISNLNIVKATDLKRGGGLYTTKEWYSHLWMVPEAPE